MVESLWVVPLALFFNVRFPSQDLLDSADDYWLGGSVYDISVETADDLIAAGYGDNVFFE